MPIDSIVIALVASGLALAVATWALLRTRRPPQQRAVADLRGRVEDLEHDLDQLHQRVSKRARLEDLATAREKHEERSKRREQIEQQAAAIVAQGAQQQPSNGQQDPAAARAAFRARVLGVH